MANIGNISATLSLNNRNWMKNLRGAEKGLTGFVRRSGRTLIRFAKRAAFYMSIIGGVGLVGLITQFAKFEEAMRNVNTIAQQNEKQFLKTSEAVVLMGREFGRAPIGLAEALYDINSASFTAARGLKVLKAATLAGRAGLSTTREAAKAITGALNAYALSAEQATDFSDIMFQSVKFGVFTFGEFAGSLGIAVSTAAAAKVPFDQLSAAIATMTRGGINVREAFTALNRVMLRIIQNRGVLGEVFATTAEGSGAAMLKVRGLSGTMAFLQKITEGDTEAMIALGFMVRDLKAALSLTRNEGRDYAKDIARIANVNARAGASMDAFREQTKALSFQFALLKAAFASLLIIIGRLIAPIFRLFLKDITNLINKLDDWVKSIKFTAEQWKSVYKTIRTFVLSTIVRIQFGLKMMWSVTKNVVNNMTVLFKKLTNQLITIFFWISKFWKILKINLAQGKGGIVGALEAISKSFDQTMATFFVTSTFGIGGPKLLKNIGEYKDILSGVSKLESERAKKLKNIAAWTGIAEQRAGEQRVSIWGQMWMKAQRKFSVAAQRQAEMPSQRALNIGAATIEKGTVEAFRAERGLKDPASKAAEETSANTKKITEILERARLEAQKITEAKF